MMGVLNDAYSMVFFSLDVCHHFCRGNSPIYLESPIFSVYPDERGDPFENLEHYKS